MSLTTAKRFTIAEYHRLAELGFFEENDRVQLIKGEIIQMAAKGTPHSVCKTRLERELYKLVSDRASEYRYYEERYLDYLENYQSSFCI
ncbi:Uma2 family endonuclease [Nostoc sp. JL31]|uniref:Uma2 family endonuclease n=1 Tax=Nostoc sp. JL31 TaxID=2815395 RepID=UPI0025D5655C|nr:Uma2 family endonuclease [Nostoc sp. JL31]